MDVKRVTRPELEREKPVRHWSAWLGNHAAVGGGGNGEPNNDAVLGVSAGYRVIEEYMRQGVAAASHATQDGQQQGVAQPVEAAHMLERMFRSAGELGTVWFEMMQSIWSAAQKPPPVSRDPGPFDLSSPEPAPAPRDDRRPSSNQVVVRVRSTRPVEVRVHIYDLGGGPFVVHELRSADAQAPRLAGVEFRWDEGSMPSAIVSLSVPDELPPGVYSGIVLSSIDDLPRATLSVRVDA